MPVPGRGPAAAAAAMGARAPCACAASGEPECSPAIAGSVVTAPALRDMGAGKNLFD